MFIKKCLSVCLVLVLLSSFVLTVNADYASIGNGSIDQDSNAVLQRSGEICIIFNEQPTFDTDSKSDVSSYLGVEITSYNKIYSSADISSFKSSESKENKDFYYVATFQLTDTNKANINSSLAVLNKRDDVLAAFENVYFNLVNREIDAQLNSINEITSWENEKIGLEAAWESGFNKADDIIIAHIGSGITFDADLEDNINWNLAHNVTQNDNDVDDSNGWGFSSAIVIGADYNDGIGVDGMCQSANIIPIRITIQGALTSYANIAAGISYAIQCDSDIIIYPFDLVVPYYDNSMVQTAFNNF